MISDALPVQEVGGVGVLDQVGGGVGGGEGDGDDEVGGGEAEQDEDEELARPPGEEALEHGDRALAVRALGGDAAVDGEGADEGDDDEDERGERGEGAGGEGGDAGLVAEGGEVVDAGQAHHGIPGLRGVRALVDMGAFGGLGLALQEPAGESAASIVPSRPVPVPSSHPSVIFPSCSMTPGDCPSAWTNDKCLRSNANAWVVPPPVKRCQGVPEVLRRRRDPPNEGARKSGEAEATPRLVSERKRTGPMPHPLLLARSDPHRHPRYSRIASSAACCSAGSISACM